MDCITFDVGEYTIQLSDDMVLIWKDKGQGFNVPADIEIPIARLEDALSTARMLVRPE